MNRAHLFSASLLAVVLSLAGAAPAQAKHSGKTARANGRVELDYVADGIVRGTCDARAGNVFFEVVAVGADAKTLSIGDLQDFGAAEEDWQGFCARILDGEDGSWLGGLAGDARCGLVWSGLEEPNEVYFADFPVSHRSGDAATTACFRAMHKKLAGYDDVAARLLFGYLGSRLQDSGRPTR